MAVHPDTKRRRPTDINQLAKAIVDSVTGDPIAEDPPVKLKKEPVTLGRRNGSKGGEIPVRKRRRDAKKSTEVG